MILRCSKAAASSHQLPRSIPRTVALNNSSSNPTPTPYANSLPQLPLLSSKRPTQACDSRKPNLLATTYSIPLLGGWHTMIQTTLNSPAATLNSPAAVLVPPLLHYPSPPPPPARTFHRPWTILNSRTLRHLEYARGELYRMLPP